MAHARAPKPGARYYLPKYTYRTVVNFCLRYYELKDELKAIDGFRSSENDGMPHGTGVSDPTSGDAFKRAEIQQKIDIIESSVRECVTGILQPYILKSITIEYVGYEYLRTVHNIPIGKNQFTELRRKVYYKIAQKI